MDEANALRFDIDPLEPVVLELIGNAAEAVVRINDIEQVG